MRHNAQRLSLLAALALTVGALTAAPSAGAQALYGLTIDRPSLSKAALASLVALPRRPTVRIYLDNREAPSRYAREIEEVAAHGTIMGELLDSSEEREVSVAAFQSHVLAYLEAFAGQVGIWEVGNEVNGNWTGPYETVSEKLTEAYEDVSHDGGVTALTLYENAFGPEHCGDGEAEATPQQFSERYVPASVADGLNYVLLSYYPTECGGRMPSAVEVALQLEALHALYPHALLGFGEVGLPHRANARRQAEAEAIMGWAYSLDPGLPYYVGGYFWWYGYEDALKAHARLAAALPAAFEAEASALGG